MTEFTLVEKEISPCVHLFKGCLDLLQIPAVCWTHSYFYLYRIKNGANHCGTRKSLGDAQIALGTKPVPIGIVCYKRGRIDLRKSYFMEGFSLSRSGYDDVAPNVDEAYKKGIHQALAKSFASDEASSDVSVDVYDMAPEERLAHEEKRFREGRDAALRAAFGLK